MNITLLKYPTDEDWAFAKQCALVTIASAMTGRMNTIGTQRGRTRL